MAVNKSIFCIKKIAMTHPLIKKIKASVSLKPEEEEFIPSFFKEKEYQRGDLLLRAGEVPHEIFFITEGLLHQFYLDEQGNERTCNFCFENDFITDLESFSQQTQSPSNIKTLEKTNCMVIRCTDLIDLLKQSRGMEEFFRIMVEEVASKSIRRTKSLLSFSPEKQFLDLMETAPEIFQHVLQKYIAQYLGIAPESLSRIKKRLMKEFI